MSQCGPPFIKTKIEKYFIKVVQLHPGVGKYK